MPTSKKKAHNKQKSVRLSTSVIPKHYTLVLNPDMEAFTYTGSEVIDIIIAKPTKTITLHSKDLHIDTVDVRIGKEKIFTQKISYNTKSETATFVFNKIIPKGKTKLSIFFDGIITETLRGFYKSSYTLKGKQKFIATTQFEPTDARRAFPCFDEPEMKASFDVSLVVSEIHTAISNTVPVSTIEHHAGFNTIRFEPTPIMSTYLLAFIIGEFEYVEGKTKDNVKVRVFTTAGKKHQAQFALDTAIKSLEFYNEYFAIPYPLPILDLIALPDFESAAMENWGAITFRETAILVDEKLSSFANKQWVAIVVCHEIAHQWFGNLVTMSWWTDLWLNEGFASYMEYVCTDHIFPEWRVWDLYLSDRYTVALRLDALQNSHPIEVTVHHPNEISEIFDMVSYAKGSAVIRLLAEYLGADTFREGLRHYMKKHSYKNTVTTDLWKSFEAVSKKNVSSIMKTWTQKTGYPLVTVSKKKNTYYLSQERFFSSRIVRKSQKGASTIWPVPVAYQSNGETLRILSTKKIVPLIGTTIGKVNKGESSFIRSRYDTETLARLKNEVESKTLAVADRLGLIRDLFALAEGGYIETTVALEFSLAYKNETEYIVWSELATGINKVYNIIANETYKEEYKSYARSLFSPLATRMGFEKTKNEHNSDTFLRSLALSHAAAYGDTKIIKKAKLLFKEKNKAPIHADIRSTIYGIIAATGSLKEWKGFLSLYENETLHEEKDRYGRALTQFKDKALLARTLTFALSSEKVRTQDAPYMILGVWQNKAGQDLAWQFIRHNWNTILKQYGEGGGLISRMLSGLGGHIKEKDANTAKKFFTKNPAPSADRILEQAYERIYSNDAWHKADKISIKKWLGKTYKK